MMLLAWLDESKTTEKPFSPEYAFNTSCAFSAIGRNN